MEIWSAKNDWLITFPLQTAISTWIRNYLILAGELVRIPTLTLQGIFFNWEMRPPLNKCMYFLRSVVGRRNDWRIILYSCVMYNPDTGWTWWHIDVHRGNTVFGENGSLLFLLLCSPLTTPLPPKPWISAPVPTSSKIDIWSSFKHGLEKTNAWIQRVVRCL